MINKLIKFKTYGKSPIHKRVLVALKDRFKINPYTELLLIENGIKPYVPKLNKIRVALSVVGVVICVAVPFITPLSIPVILWGLK